MRQVTGRTSTYSSDEFGVCSAFYELGGMVVMHDASGCNSTYTTHDEPRWYDMDSMIYISAISEMEAIMGDDEKFITDLIETANELHPGFIALVGAPIPYMIGTDFPAIASIVEAETGIPCFGFSTNGMQLYPKGVSAAMETCLELAIRDGAGNTERNGKQQKGQRPKVNILGATPLDLPLSFPDKMREWLRQQGYEPGICLSMDCRREDLIGIADADLNLVVSAGGLAVARRMQELWEIPYVTGIPYGSLTLDDLNTTKDTEAYADDNLPLIAIIGESVQSVSLGKALESAYSVRTKVLCPLDTEPELLRADDWFTPGEDDITEGLEGACGVIADPLYVNLLGGRPLFSLGHTAFSGRMFEKNRPDLLGHRLNDDEELHRFIDQLKGQETEI